MLPTRLCSAIAARACSYCIAIFIMIGASAVWVIPAFAVDLENDPKGFNGIPWGTSLSDRPDLIPVGSVGPIKEYDRKDG
ncbi:MAG: hypothetical protein C4293_10845, partial [Nitrospiraceae bacterium]